MIQSRSRIRWRSLMSLGGGLAMVVSRDECEYECECEQVGAAGC
jgi:hypothetical protein